MAIEKTVFNDGVIGDVANWLSANKDGSFDSVTLVDGTISCYIGEQAVLTLAFASSAAPYGTTIGITPIGESTEAKRYFSGSSSDVKYIFSGYKTSKGLAMCSTYGNSLVICKDKDGNVCFVIASKNGTSGNYYNCEVWEIENSNTYYIFAYLASGSSWYFTNFGINNADMSLVPILGLNGNVLDGAFMSYHTPYFGDTLKGGITIQLGTSGNFAYTGIFALAE